MSAALLAGALFGPAPGVWAAEYPSRSIRLLIPTPAGGGTDILARVATEGISKHLGQPVIIENRGGASGMIAAELVATAPPDGYTMLMTYSGVLTVNQSVFKKMAYDPIRDFAPVAAVADVPNILIVNPAVPANTVAELIALARAQPGKLNFASSGNGTSIFLAMELLRQKAGLNMVHILYKGGAPAMADVIAGQVQLMFNNLVEALPQIKAGKVRALGIATASRSPLVPDIPTVAESGLPGYESRLWYGIVAPVNTPAAAGTRMNDAVRATLQAPEVRSRLSAMGADPIPMSPAEFGSLIKRDAELWGRVVREAGIKPD